jgi:DNA-directed RNA polymerase subunit RPC12/RpoP
MGRSIPIEEVVEPHPHNRRRAPISVTHPHLTAEWYYKKNCGFGPEDFSYGSDVSPWWRCLSNKKHIWQAAIQLRASRGFLCPYCTSRRLSPENSLAACFPQIARQWHPTKNKKLQPSDFAAHSKHKAWWLCATCGYEWKTAIGNRTSIGNNCYRCAKNVLDLRNYPHALAYFDKKRNKGLDPTWLTMHLKIHWRCPKGRDHLWCQTFTKKCSEKRFCPFCSNRQVSKTNNLAKLHPKLSKEWHPKLNGQLSPDMVSATSGSRVWWLCAKCSHSFTTRVHDRSVRQRGCTECWKERRSEVMKLACSKSKTPLILEKKVLSLFCKGVSQSEIARRLKLNRNTIHRILVREQLLD